MSDEPIESGTRAPAARERRRSRRAEPGAPPAPAEDVLRIHYVHDWRGVGTAGSADPNTEGGDGSPPQDPTAGPALPHRRPPRVVYVNDWREREANDEG